MNTYVMSDIHGCYDKFINMLEKINFNNSDQLILAGDYIDRGTQNIEMLRWLESAPDNVLLIKGNHDVEFAQCIGIILSVIRRYNINTENMIGKDIFKIYNLIKEELNGNVFDYYGTLKQLLLYHEVTLDDLIRWKQIIDGMPYYFKIMINGTRHIIVHAGYISNVNYELVKNNYEDIESFYIYAREDSIRYGGLKDLNIIFGHTPTIAFGKFYNNGEVYQYTDNKNNCTYYNIDCGIAYYSDKHSNAKLACLKLEDKSIFYVS